MSGRGWLAVLMASWSGWQAELGIDDEFTRPGLICMLEKFKGKVEDIEQDEDDEIIFSFQ